MHFPTIIYILCIFLTFFNIIQLYYKYHFDNNCLFIILTNYILNITLTIFWLGYHNYVFSLIISILLLAFSFLHILNIKEKIGNLFIFTIPYFIFCTYIFSLLVNYFITLDF